MIWAGRVVTSKILGHDLGRACGHTQAFGFSLLSHRQKFACWIDMAYVRSTSVITESLLHVCNTAIRFPCFEFLG